MSSFQQIGTYICVDCPGEGGAIEGYAGDDIDGDGILNCEDDDDGIPDQSDNCPAGPLSEAMNLPNGPGDECTVFETCNCPLIPKPSLGCLLGDCFETLNKLDSLINPDPTMGGVIDQINMKEVIQIQ